ncbi:MAG: hypothetical protein Fur0037_27320 [Planctomycetota bacterium]
MLRVVFVSATDEIGGADQSLFELVASLDRARIDPLVVLPHEGPFAKRYRELGVRVRVVPLRKLKNTANPLWHLRWIAAAPFRVLRLLRLFAEIDADVIHVNTSVEVLAGVAAAIHCRRRRCRLVWHVREMELRPRIVERVLFGAVRRLADAVIAISTPVARRIGERERVFVIPNGIDLSRHRAGRNRAGLEAGPILGWVGRIAPGKGLGHVLDAFRLVRNEIPSARLLVMGAAVKGHEDLAARLRRTAAEMGPAVRWLEGGPCTERAFARMDLFLHLPDVEEGLGRTVLEAQASGVPAVVWPRGGLVDAVKDGVTGRFAPAGDVQAAARAAVSLLRDTPGLLRMSESARAFVAERFAREGSARAVERAYEEVLA